MNNKVRIWAVVILSFFMTRIYADNLSVGSVQLLPNNTQQISIKLNSSSANYTAFQFDMVVPDGVKMVGDVSLTDERKGDHQLHAELVGTNTYRFLVYSKTNCDLAGKDGALINLALKADDFNSNETKTAKIQSQLFVQADGSKHSFSDFSYNITIIGGAHEDIEIGKNGKTTYCSSKALDFSVYDDLKAYVATGFDATGTIWLTRIKQVPANTPILIKGEANRTYGVPVMNKCIAYFENMFQGSVNKDQTVSTTTADGKYKNFYMSGGQFKPASASQKISAGKAYLQVPASFNAAVSGSNQTVKISDSGKSSYAPPVDIDLTNVEGLKAYAATGYDAASQTIWLTRIFKIQAGEGVMLKGEAGKEYTLTAAAVQSYYGNMFVGNIGDKITINETSNDGQWTNFYLASGSFKKVSGTREIGTNKSYLHLPASMLVSNARGKKDAGIDEWLMDELETETILLGSIGSDDDGTTKIDAIDNDNAQPDVYYNLQGQRVDNPKKGLYIKNGKKVIVK